MGDYLKLDKVRGMYYKRNQEPMIARGHYGKGYDPDDIDRIVSFDQQVDEARNDPEDIYSMSGNDELRKNEAWDDGCENFTIERERLNVPQRRKHRCSELDKRRQCY